MKFLKNIENQAITVKQMTIIKAFLVMLTAILLEILGQIPIEILNLFFKRFTKVAPYLKFVTGVLVKYFIITLLLKWHSKNSCEKIHKKRFNRKNFIYVALIIIGFRIVYDNSLIYWVNKIPMPDFINQAFEELAMSPIIMILSAVVIAPIYEEIVFRGILLRGMANKINPTLALIVSALFFALMHMNIPQGINAFLLGLIIGSIYLNTGSIYLSIFAHFINNSTAISISGAFQLISGKYATLIHGTAFIVGSIILIVAYRWLNQNKPGNKLDIYKESIEI
ncbi:CPBP family intramembrane metalloprotease [Clostridium sp. CM028]|uniref:CPBP family intramembrane glutamic endopeptidase n=1 Tax=unclassified Clostridium TaxID=2614128 RepID=UPI001C0E14CD|nr:MULTISPECIES: type II CAAX endopeptidase family protein [unclassified Clostridium]MBU3092536.1 CPBP family intramembrane metalloprotease [Clostridium sp. CF011]MBW9146347.1 CPBP family intramembrane metalloprotease [Clostridium sp. CM027]MBW9150052.1 CPBP family intramembrane metalloprotease [Clostridium sp. CM028]UVE39859.1 CPBP family intramembrane metalloprotease [Clostridium sp. CM027]WAG68775.1 CPBP family intramembrane metalloprotease [Clostridium sp. CF011]